MTRDEILAMEPGRELDALVAEKVMGLTTGPDSYFDCAYEADDALHFSTDIAAAWEVESTMNESKLRRVLYTNRLRDVILHEKGTCSDFDLIHATPAQRCKAALLAVMEG